MKLHLYEIKFKRFTDGVWDNLFRKTSISAENEYQAVFQHGQTNGVAFPEQNIEDIIIEISGGNIKEPKILETEEEILKRLGYDKEPR